MRKKSITDSFIAKLTWFNILSLVDCYRFICFVCLYKIAQTIYQEIFSDIFLQYYIKTVIITTLL